MPSMVVNGMDVREVRDSFRTVLDAMRKRPYPFFIEARTYRYRGHSMSDPATYRTKEELDKYKNEDPIVRFQVSPVSGRQARRCPLCRNGPRSQADWLQNRCALPKRARNLLWRICTTIPSWRGRTSERDYLSPGCERSAG